MRKTISASTGDLLSSGTIGQRLIAVISYYVSGARHGWYSIGSDKLIEGNSRCAEDPISKSHAIRIDASLIKLVPKQSRAQTDIKPLSPEELRAVLKALAPSEEETKKGTSRGMRDRLIAEWLASVGLRLSEALCPNGKAGLTTHQILQLTPDPRYPFEHSIVRVLGKGDRWRNVAVPNWLISKTIDYIHGERAQATKHLRRPTSKLFVAGLSSLAKDRGRAITGRAFEKAFEVAGLRAGLYKFQNEALAGSDQKQLKKRALHCPHDLRHTYAIATYFAERSFGNPEPWKQIQAQLGHKHLVTTVNTYLAYVSAHDAWQRDISRVSVRELAGIGSD
jgi:integrase